MLGRHSLDPFFLEAKGWPIFCWGVLFCCSFLRRVGHAIDYHFLSPKAFGSTFGCDPSEKTSDSSWFTRSLGINGCISNKIVIFHLGFVIFHEKSHASGRKGIGWCVCFFGCFLGAHIFIILLLLAGKDYPWNVNISVFIVSYEGAFCPCPRNQKVPGNSKNDELSSLKLTVRTWK